MKKMRDLFCTENGSKGILEW